MLAQSLHAAANSIFSQEALLWSYHASPEIRSRKRHARAGTNCWRAIQQLRKKLKPLSQDYGYNTS
eukprot:3242400-Heterocapsa_arctica.AAC.1